MEEEKYPEPTLSLFQFAESWQPRQTRKWTGRGRFDISGRRLAFSHTDGSMCALYCTLLHALGSPRKHFNLAAGNSENREYYGPLKELLL